MAVKEVLSAEQRRTEVASILAAGIVRLRLRVALSTYRPGAEKPEESAANPLEVLSEKWLSVHAG
jgi:hypothetical protein